MAREHAQINFRIPDELREKIDAAREESGRSLTGEIVARLEQSFALDDMQARMLRTTQMVVRMENLRYVKRTKEQEKEFLALQAELAKIPTVNV